MGNTLKFIFGLLILFATISGGVWFLIRWLKRSPEDPGRLISKWIISAVALGIVIWGAASTSGDITAVAMVPFAVAVGLILTVLWGTTVGEWFARLFTNSIDGGDERSDDRPLYSVAEGLRRRGRPEEAIAETRKQLDRFPTDFAGQILLAEIQATDLHDLPAAAITLERLANQPNHPQKNRAYALNRLADWHLQFAHDPDSARVALEKVRALFPESEHSNLAAQRLAHLTTPDAFMEKVERKPVALPRAEADLFPEPPDAAVAEADALAHAQELINQLGTHPLDFDARESLASLYADQLNRLDLAVEQLEQLIAFPNQTPRHVDRWLNRIADLHIRCNGDETAAREAVQRIVDLFPDTAFAEKAKTRLAGLTLELRGKQKSQAVKLGSYEDDLGLKPRV